MISQSAAGSSGCIHRNPRHPDGLETIPQRVSFFSKIFIHLINEGGKNVRNSDYCGAGEKCLPGEQYYNKLCLYCTILSGTIILNWQVSVPTKKLLFSR